MGYWTMTLPLLNSLTSSPSSPPLSEPATPEFHSAVSSPETLKGNNIKVQKQQHKITLNIQDFTDLDCLDYMEPYSPIPFSTPLMANPHVQFAASPPYKGQKEVLKVPVKNAKRQAVNFTSLSNLPTPPEVHEDEYPLDCGFPEVTVAHMRDPELLGRAKYLNDLIPSRLSKNSPTRWFILSILVRAGNFLEIGTVALAGCILDSLSRTFPVKWRQAIYNEHQKEERPELIAICALVIAVKFTYDNALSNSFWCDEVLDDRFPLWAINLTERMMLQDIDYSTGYLALKELDSAMREINAIVSREVQGDEQEEEEEEDEEVEESPEYPYYSDLDTASDTEESEEEEIESTIIEYDDQNEMCELYPVLQQTKVKNGGFVFVERVYPDSKGAHKVIPRLPDLREILLG